MKTIRVATRSPYDVLIGSGLLSSVGALTAEVKKPCRVLIVSDDRVFPLYGKAVKESLENAGYRTSEYIFPHGESSKNLAVFGSILECAAREHLTRTDLIAALGGGVVGDITGYAACTYLRRICGGMLLARNRFYPDSDQSSCGRRFLGRRQNSR